MAEFVTDVQYFSEGGTDSYYADQLSDLLMRNDDRFTHTSGENTFTIDGNFDVRVVPDTISGYRVMNIYAINPNNTSETVLLCRPYIRTDNYNAKMLRLPNMFYLELTAQTREQYAGGIFFWIQQDGKNFLGGLWGSGQTSYTTWAIEGSTIYCEEENDSSYKIKKLADYSLNAQNLFFSNVCVLVSSVGNFLQLENFYSSSNVTYRHALNTNSRTYFAIGTNTLFDLGEDT